MRWRDIYDQISPTQARLHDGTGSISTWVSGVSNDFRNYNPANSKFANVATTRAGSIDPQRSFVNFSGSGRYGTFQHWLANSSSNSDGGNRISYLSPSGSRPNSYYWNQDFQYLDPTKAALSNQQLDGLNFYRLSDGNKTVMDQFTNTSLHWLYYNQINLDNNILTLSNSGVISKIEVGTSFQDNTTNPTTPLLFQTHGGLGANGSATMVTDYPRDANWNSADRDTYIIYRPNFGSNTNISADIETMGEWISNWDGGRSGS